MAGYAQLPTNFLPGHFFTQEPLLPNLRRSRIIQNQNLFCHFPQSCVAILLAHFLKGNLLVSLL